MQQSEGNKRKRTAELDGAEAASDAAVQRVVTPDPPANSKAPVASAPSASSSSSSSAASSSSSSLLEVPTASHNPLMPLSAGLRAPVASGADALSSPRKPRTPAHSVLLSSLQNACDALELDQATSSVAWKLLSRIATHASTSQLKEHIDSVENQRAWMLCSLFTACRLSEGEAPSVTRLLNYCGVKLTHFCRHLHHFMAHLKNDLPEAFAERVSAFEHSLLSVVGIYYKYEKLYNKHVKPNAGPQNASVLFGFGWLLFIAAKAELKMLGHQADLHRLFVLLLCVLRLLSGGQQQQKQQQTPATGGQSSDDQKDAVLAQLCSMPVAEAGAPAKVNQSLYGAVRSMQIERFDVFLQLLVREKVLDVGDTGDASAALHPDRLPANVNALTHHYDGLVCSDNADDSGFWLDERLFLSDRFKNSIGTPLTRPTHTVLPVHPDSSSHRRLFAEFRGGATPAPGKEQLRPYAFEPVMHSPRKRQRAVPQTPVSRMMECVSWLAQECKGCKPEPSAELAASLATCSPNPAPHITQLVSKLAKKFNFQSGSSSSDSEVSCHRQELALKLFYVMLERLVNAERRRLGPKRALGGWLSTPSFHTAVLACCFQLVVFSYKDRSLAFPAVLDSLGLDHWSFLKILESAVRVGCPNMPAGARAHCTELENRILEQLAWRGDSTLRKLLRLETSTSHISRCFEPKRGSVYNEPRPLPMQTIVPDSFASNTPRPQLGSAKANAQLAALEVFYRKLLGLAAERVDLLCRTQQLGITPGLVDVVWALVRHVLLHQSELMFDRHLDTLVLCAIYTVCNKLAKRDLTFKRILAVYLSRWEYKNAEVVREVPGPPQASGKPRSLNIIMFYNEVYIPAIKQFAVSDLTPAIRALDAPEPTVPGARPASALGALPRRAHLSPRKVARNSNVYLSPMRAASHAASMTPMTKALYAFGESPRRNLQQMNEMINAGRMLFGDDKGPGSGQGAGGRLSFLKRKAQAQL